MYFGGQRVNQTFESLAQARDYRDSKRIQRNTDPDFKKIVGAQQKQKQHSTLTLHSQLERYKLEVSVTKSMPSAEIHRIDAIQRADIAKLPFASVGDEDISGFLLQLKRGEITGKESSQSNALKYLAIFSHLFNIARKRWKIKVHNPVADIEKPRAGDSRDRRISDKELRAIIQHFDGSRNANLAPLVELALLSAARMGELLSLTWSSIDFRERVLKISGHRDAQGNLETRVVPFDFVAPGERMDRLLTRLRPKKPRPESKVFNTTQTAVEQAWKRMRVRLELEGLNFHDIRHEAVSRLYESGRWRDLEIMQGVGHKSLQMTKRYTHLKLKTAARQNRARAKL